MALPRTYKWCFVKTQLSIIPKFLNLSPDYPRRLIEFVDVCAGNIDWNVDSCRGQRESRQGVLDDVTILSEHECCGNVGLPARGVVRHGDEELVVVGVLVSDDDPH